ncbi:phosphatidate cytidylyltransferase [Acaricomes phytoseiuli]|uniref:phosphatidate cytidylyltransferase n=1 Tax=Acaricomes phytoseiuli TaxID=291968 RepID=UPI00039F44D8|nr:phosphatidate cytidylyltransferase [Acaricomes phytoseiuli]
MNLTPGSDPSAAQTGPADTATGPEGTSIPSRRALRAAERAAEQQEARRGSHRAVVSPSQASPEGRRVPSPGPSTIAAESAPVPVKTVLASTAPADIPVSYTAVSAAEVSARHMLASPAPSKKRVSRAGRNLPAAIGVGLGLLAIVLVGLLVYPPAFMLIVIAASALGTWEVLRGFAQYRITVPVAPVAVAVLGMPVVAYYVGAEGLVFAFMACCLALFLWRLLDGRPGAAQGVMAGVFVVAWIPFMICFVLLMLREQSGPATFFSFSSVWPSEGALRVVTVLLLVVANDTFGYLIGVLFGKHPMAPKVSPKKSWEGFAGSVVGAMLVGTLVAIFLLDEPFWFGILLAFVVVAAATAGDLAESMVKRELKIKDMSSILPGHGGLMDRLDSILFAAPASYLAFELLDLLRQVGGIG